jgi:hypothetical protein
MNNDINNIHNYFRNLHNNIKLKEYQKVLQPEKIEIFCMTLADFILKALSIGFCQLDSNTINFTNKYSKDYFITGFNLLQNGIHYNTVIVSLDFLSTFISKTANDITANELLEINILETVLPMIQRFDIKNYLYTITNFCSGQSNYKLFEMYKEYINN